MIRTLPEERQEDRVLGLVSEEKENSNNKSSITHMEKVKDEMSRGYVI